MHSEILLKAGKLLENFHLCNSCLGRQFGNLLSGLSNSTRGMAIKTVLLMEWENQHRLTGIPRPDFSSYYSTDFEIGITSIKRYFPDSEVVTKQCDLCHDLLLPSHLDQLANRAFTKLKEFEFKTYLVGCIIPPSIIEQEDNIRSNFNLEFGESIKPEFNRELGKKLQKLVPHAAVEFKAPDVVITFDLSNNDIVIKSNPLFILGRYRKLQRGIPQSKWFCRKCRGKGCEHCNFTGKMYQESVEEFVSEPFLHMTRGTATKFHGAGREDIDARMLGTGRPFVLEISEPKIRTLDLDSIRDTIMAKAEGKVEVDFEGYTSRTKVRELKTRSTLTAKAYRATVSLDPPITLDDDTISRVIKELTTNIIHQRTPHRVAHRRADKIRTRKVKEFKFEKISPDELVVYVLCDGGLYVKELISGDEGRTNPNLSDLLNTKAVVTELDVIEVLTPSDPLRSTKSSESL